jgi:hypothetical protein
VVVLHDAFVVVSSRLSNKVHMGRFYVFLCTPSLCVANALEINLQFDWKVCCLPVTLFEM